MKGERKPGQKAETACSMPSLVYATWHGDPGTSRTSENANRKTRDSYVAAQGSMATIAMRNVSRDLAPWRLALPLIRETWLSGWNRGMPTPATATLEFVGLVSPAQD